MKKALLLICGLTALTLTSCKGCECKFQGDLDNKRWEMRQRRHMQFKPHFDKMRVEKRRHNAARPQKKG